MGKAVKLFNANFSLNRPIGTKFSLSQSSYELKDKFIYGFLGVIFFDDRGVGSLYRGLQTDTDYANYVLNLFDRNNKYIFKSIPWFYLSGIFTDTYGNLNNSIPLGKIPYCPVNNYVDFSSSYFEKIRGPQQAADGFTLLYQVTYEN